MHVDDLADACYFLLQNYNEEGIVNIGCGTDISIIKLAELITKLSFDSDLRRRMGTKGRNIIEKDNNATVEWNKVLSLYRSLV